MQQIKPASACAAELGIVVVHRRTPGLQTQSVVHSAETAQVGPPVPSQARREGYWPVQLGPVVPPDLSGRLLASGLAPVRLSDPALAHPWFLFLRRNWFLLDIPGSFFSTAFKKWRPD